MQIQGAILAPSIARHRVGLLDQPQQPQQPQKNHTIMVRRPKDITRLVRRNLLARRNQLTRRNQLAQRNRQRATTALRVNFATQFRSKFASTSCLALVVNE